MCPTSPNAAQAISTVVERVQSGGLDYPVEGLAADRFHGGWCVYAPVMVADGDVPEDPDAPVPRQLDSSLPSHPDFSGFARPRQPADYDREVVAALARALTHERDSPAGWATACATWPISWAAAAAWSRGARTRGRPAT